MKKLYYILLFLLSGSFVGNSYALDGPSSSSEQIRMNLYGFYPDSSTYILDGTLTRYADTYSDSIDINDSKKLYNSGENISMVRGGFDLIVECRHTISITDTIFFRMWGMQKKSYRLEFVASNLNHPGLQGYLQDTYLHTSSPVQLNDTTRFTISINNDPASYAQNRFRLVFNTPTPAIPPAPHYTSLNVTQLNSNILVTWNTLNQNTITQYFVEKSTDGIHFSDVASIASVNASGLYHWTDHYPADQLNYYRIREVTTSGTIDYTQVITVKSLSCTGISIYPNPATSTNLNIKFNNQKPGIYKIMLINSGGHMLSSENYSYPGGTSIKKLQINAVIPPGIYHVEVSQGGTGIQVLSVVL